MVNETFKNIDPDDFHGKELSLHDCIANRISVEKNIIRFILPDGFWITPDHGENDCGKVVRTDASAVEFSVADISGVTAWMFTEERFWGLKKSRAETWGLAQLIAALNEKNCTLEFVTQYRSFYEQLWYCVIHSDKKPYYRECYLHLPRANASFYWNRLCEEREW